MTRDDDHGKQLSQIIADYLQAVEAGQEPDREQLLTDHPEVAQELREFLSTHDQMHEAAGPPSPPQEDATIPPRPSSEDHTLAPDTTSGNATLGTKIRYFGDYELLDEIARGGMGVVYKARQTSLNRIVALKMILAGQLAGEEDVQRFQAEAEAAANLDHPGIVPIYEIGEHEGQHYFSMGFVEGESLADKIKDGPLPPLEAVEYVKKVAEAIAFAHERGVIHRDLKPANVLLDLNGEPKVTDFGLAKRVEGDSGLTATGQILGTPSYMPPEQASGQLNEVRETADVYALGAVLYCLISGHPPFQAAAPLDTLMQVLEREPISPRLLNNRVPRDLETICLKALEKDARGRYQSAQSLAAELERFLNDEPILARPISGPARAWRWCKRKPILAAMQATLALLLGTLAIGGPLVAIQQAALNRAASEARSERALAQVAALLSASPQAVPVIIDTLKPDETMLRPKLRDVLRDPETTESQRVRVHFALLNQDSASHVNYLLQRMMLSDVEEFLLIREFLEPYRETLNTKLWMTAADASTSPRHRFRAAVALALYDAPNPKWREIAQEVVRALVSENSLVVGRWVEALRPVRGQLLAPLVEVFRDRSEDAAPRRFLATSILADYAADRPELLIELLVESSAQQCLALIGRVEAHSEVAVALLANHLPVIGESPQVRSAESEVLAAANAAVALVRLGQGDLVWPLLRDFNDPRLPSYLIHRFATHGAPADALVSAAKQTTDAATRRVLILGIGEFAPTALGDEQKHAFLSWLVECYRDQPDPSVHAACDWVLRRAGREAEIARIDNQLSSGKPEERRRWMVNSQKQTYAIVDGGDFSMGSPASESGRRADEPQHVRAVVGPFAVACKEVTVAEFQRFLHEHPEIEHSYSRQHSPLATCPQTSVTWYEAAAYCNWLSAQDKIPRAQWCFHPNSDQRYAAGMHLAEDYLTRTGYRLPTEAEWELACRAGAATSRCYGDAESLLSQYAWYLANAMDHSWTVGLKKPNRLGLFDMHGNVWEWCAEPPRPYPLDSQQPCIDQIVDYAAIENGQPRALRGGSYFYHSIYTRSALRNKEPVDARYYGIGMRPVRTMP